MLIKEPPTWSIGATDLMPRLPAGGPRMASGVFPENLVYRITFRTDGERLAALLPAGIGLDGASLVHFVYRHSEHLDWIDGGELNLVGVCVAAVFRGKDEARGMYWPVLWENDCMAVILGREIMGVAKLYADITNPLRVGGVWHAFASLRGRRMFEFRLGNLRPLTGDALDEVRRQAEAGCTLGWKHIPAVDLSGHELSHATHYQSPNRVEQAWMGDGEVIIHAPDPLLEPWTHQIVETLRALPLVFSHASLLRGSGEHRISSGRVLR